MMLYFQKFFILLILLIHLIKLSLEKFMIKSNKEILTPHNLDDVYQTNLQHEMVKCLF